MRIEIQILNDKYLTINSSEIAHFNTKSNLNLID